MPAQDPMAHGALGLDGPSAWRLRSEFQQSPGLPLGDATVLVAERDGHVVATISTALRPMCCPDGATRIAACLADLKVAPAARRGLVHASLLQAMRDHVGEDTRGFGYAVVMDGTVVMPWTYTGRLGIPALAPAARLTLLRIATKHDAPDSVIEEASQSDFDSAWQRLARPGYVPLGGSAALRSLREPVHLVSDDGSACGRVEDTRRGKRLMLDAEKELDAAHLSRFAFATPRDGARLIRGALSHCAQAGVPSLFVSLPRDMATTFVALLADLSVHPAGATVFAAGVEPGIDWWMDTWEM